MAVDVLSLLAHLAAYALPVVLAVTLHEVAHGWMARLFGDPTAAEAGRLTLNPVAHVDPVGTLIVPGLLLIFAAIAGKPPMLFGWAKPVPVDWRRLRRPRLGIALVALAGPGANLLMLAGWTLLMWLAIEAPGPWSPALIYMGQAGIISNAVLMLLNLIPVPPLDGSRVVTVLLPRALARPYASLERYGLVILLLMLATGVLGQVLGPPLGWLMAGVEGLVGVGA